jgi:hypothetical protein
LGFQPRQYWASWSSSKGATPTNRDIAHRQKPVLPTTTAPPTVTAKAIGAGARRQFLDCVAWIRQQTAVTRRFSQPNNLNIHTIAVAKAPSTSKLNIAKASRRALSNDFRACPLSSLPALGFCAAIHAATVLPWVTCAWAVLRATRSSWIAASHNARSFGGNSACACRSNRENNPATTFVGAGYLGLKPSSCFVNNAAFAVAAPGKS